MRANWIDRTIGTFAPRVAYDRVIARARFDAIQKYSGAALGRHTDGWKTRSTSADSEIGMAGPRLRDRHRDLVRNDPHAAKAVSSWVSYLIGDGIQPRSENDKAMKAFATWSKQCDPEGLQDLYGLQTLACREMIEGGEVLVRRRRRRPSDGFHVPLQLQLLEADFLDATRTGVMEGGNTAIQGVEFDKIGGRAAYWLFSEHPGNNFIGSLAGRLQSKPTPARELLHLYEKQRTQVRGVPWGAPILRRARDLDDYEFAEGIRKKMTSSQVGVVVGDDNGEMGVTNSAASQVRAGIVDSQGRPIEQMEPGLFGFLRGGKDIKFNQPVPDMGYAEYKKAALKGIAAGYRLPYELLSGDLSEVNFSSIRAGEIAFRRLVSAMQYQIIIPMFCQPLWDWFCEAAYLAGLIDSPDVPVEWSPPTFEYVDPYKDALTALIELRSGTRSYPEVMASLGRDWRKVLPEIKAWFDALDKDKIVLDSDARHTSGAGVLQGLIAAQANAPAQPNK
jgi:lambda family phage portal protein